MQNKKKILPNFYNFLLPKQTKNLSRFGINKDGGYVVDMKVMENINYFISFGMGDEFTFEQQFLKMNKKNFVEIYDHSIGHLYFITPIIKSFRRFVTFRKNLNDLFYFIKKYFNFLFFINHPRVEMRKLKITEKVKFKNEKNVREVFLNTKDKKLGLKIDIEGDEYKILEEVNNNHDSINILIVEFHNIEKEKDLFFSMISKLKKNFDILHLHGNNHDKILSDGFPNVAEVTFLNKKNNSSYTNTFKSFPLKNLDFPNNPNLPDIEFEFE